MSKPTPTDRASRILKITRVVLIDCPYTETIAPNAETGGTQQFGQLERLRAA